MNEQATSSTNDAGAREHALDIRRSVLVQAPAGAGKTGLLIQRYLGLLAHASRPEEIVAMTFTRKAAAEMQERVLEALRDAADGIEAASPHAAKTRALAREVVEHSKAHGFDIVANPARLRILTIDALCTALARQAPVATALGSLPAFIDDATPLYLEAAREALAHAPADDPRWQMFLARLDNDASATLKLLGELLSRRDQWRHLYAGTDSTTLRRHLEAALVVEIERGLDFAQGFIEPPLALRLARSARHAAAHHPDAEVADALVRLVRFGGVPSAQADALPVWRHLAGWVLVADDPRMRATVTVKHGFPPTKVPVMERAKQEMTELLRDLSAVRGFAEALHHVRLLPPTTYDDDAWAFIEATLSLLPEIAARLESVFTQRRRSDFIEATLRTLMALGEGDRPGELLLAVDYRVSHLLVDEFQDTSLSQLELIERLTAGFTPGDGRTLFAVGDPMQSIYRFREAEVGIFLAAQEQHAMGDVPVETVELTRNFRSSRAIVDWVNETFTQVLPARSDAARAEVAYRPVVAAEDAVAGSRPTLTLCPDRAAEAEAVVDRVREALAAGAQDIGILVRARQHLDAILPALRAGGIEFAAVEIESLAERLATRDLITLTRVLTQPADRGAVMALLRAPWCGLMLADLLALGAIDAPTLIDALADREAVATLSTDGAQRASRVASALLPFFEARGRMSLARRVRGAWLALGGPACAEANVDRAGAERFVALVSEHERAGDLPNFDAFVAAAEGLFAAPAAPPHGGVQVMTLHKAKGLEFDTVILPGLDRATRGLDSPVLRWRRRGEGEEAALLIAPTRTRSGATSKEDPVYTFLKLLDAAEEDAELGRLLYVGCTRAKRSLHLCAVLGASLDKQSGEVQWSKAASRTALAKLWPAIASMAAPPPMGQGIEARDEDAAPRAPPLARLSCDWRPPAVPPPLPRAAAPSTTPEEIVFDWAHATAAAIGTIVHRALATFARDGIAAWSTARIDAQRARFMSELAREGVPRGEISDAADAVQHALKRTLSDPRGQWLFDPKHEDAHSEWPLASVDLGEIAHVSVDRTFVSGGERWIVDFKTGRHEGANREAFLAQEAERYRAQLARYARIVGATDSRPIRVALYYPLIDDGFHEVAL